jgi:hypothetical protein
MEPIGNIALVECVCFTDLQADRRTNDIVTAFRKGKVSQVAFVKIDLGGKGVAGRRTDGRCRLLLFLSRDNDDEQAGYKEQQEEGRRQ